MSFHIDAVHQMASIALWAMLVHLLFKLVLLDALLFASLDSCPSRADQAVTVLLAVAFFLLDGEGVVFEEDRDIALIQVSL